MVFHIKLYGWLRSAQTSFLSLLQEIASGKLQLLKDPVHSAALLIHQLHKLPQANLYKVMGKQGQTRESGFLFCCLVMVDGCRFSGH